MSHLINKKQKLTSHSSKCEGTSELAKAIHCLTSGNQESLGEEEISCSLGVIEQESRSSGLSPDYIIALVDAIGDEKFDLATRKRLLSCLKPLGPLPEQAVIKAISWITVQKLPSTLQVRFVKWIVLVYDRLDGTSNISLLYSILFEFLKNSVMCPYICQLFCKMTKREHVNPFRIKQLINMQPTMGKHPDYMKLKEIYANFRPDLMILNASKPKIDAQQAQPPFVVNQELMKFDRQLAEIQMSSFGTSLSILLTSDQKRLLFTNLSEEFMLAFRCFVRDALFSGKSSVCNSSPYCKEENLLPILSDITSELQENIPEVVVYVESLLQRWDGQSNREILLNFIEHWDICEYSKLLETVLQPLYKLFVVSSVEFMCSIIRCLTNLYRHWTFFELPRVTSETSSSANSEDQTLSIFSKKPSPDDPEEQIDSLSLFLDHLCTFALLSNPNKPVLLLNDILRFYEMVLAAHASNMSILLLPPSVMIMASLVFSTNPLFVSEMCGLMCRYKDAVYVMKQANCMSGRNSHIIPIVNKYIIDMSNMLGLGAAFKLREDSIFQISPSFMEPFVDAPHECFSIFRHPALLGLVLCFQKEHDEDFHPDMLLKESTLRTKYLDFISSSKFSDITLFLRTFVKKMSVPS